MEKLYLYRNVSCLVLLFVLFMPVAVAKPQKSLYNPKPADNDIELPLPDGEVMVFRKIRVPGKSFWGDLNRLVQLGDAAGGMFEGLQRLQVSGSFPDKEDWYYFIGKYEVTLGQYIAVMGMERLLQVSADPKVKNLPALKDKALRKMLRKPLVFIPFREYQAFIETYNQWLFDPEHPQRLQPLPKNAGVPGFVRLPTEIEWENASRGGEVARRKKTYSNPQPFPAGKANKYAWHLGNAKHKLRPIGLRKPNSLGIHDMLGNAQEIVDGRFLPEIWQGQPGGIPVRGGSVSTPAQELRSSLRSELDAWSWNPDKAQMTPRASFNTGMRLAIGSNVVSNPQQKNTLMREYQDYLSQLRRKTPVGQTLSNLVAQAGQSLTSMDPIMKRLMEQHPDLKSDLAAIQHYLDKAHAQLDSAQKASARSLAQDAARNGVNYSIYLSREKKLQSALDKVKQLLEISTRYQKNVDSVQHQLQETQQSAKDQFAGYIEKLTQLGEYDQPYIKQAFADLKANKVSGREAKVLELLAQQVENYRKNRRSDETSWRQSFVKTFDEYKD